ncbi:protein ADM2a [Genypterus blacodes]|uniref:protein ADM2a n=1 Tax=Genypterus blacodes TaxID=154954 RepID=UPI003F7604E6
MQSLLPLTVYCISLFSLQQLVALPAEDRPDTSSSDFLMMLRPQTEETALTPGSQAHVAAAAATSSPTGKYAKWLPGFLRDVVRGVRVASPGLAWAQPTKTSQRVHQRAIRGRRHTHSGSRGGHHHGQLMRVGCVLGTCQVQNLSHRLYQLIGQSGREDSSPINPRSPHSYG